MTNTGGQRLLSLHAFFEILGGAGDINSSISIPNYCDGTYNDLGKCVNKDLSAWTEVWSGNCRSSKRFFLPGGRSGQIFEIFEILGVLVIPITRQVCPTTVMDHIATLVNV